MKSRLSILLVVLLAVSCSRTDDKATDTHRGVYHWKTTYDPCAWEKDWMQQHHIDRIYVKFFEVDDGRKHGYPEWNMAPVATTRFLQQLPSDIDVVPVVYITVDAIRALGEEDAEACDRYAGLFVQRICDMAREHWSGTLREVQIDCDWTQTTRLDFFRLAKAISDRLDKQGIMLSGTVRLHQLQDADIPFRRKLLMCYNTGRLQDRNTHNSILDYDDALPYLRKSTSRQLSDYDVAWPVYGWGVAFDQEGHFIMITTPEQSEGVRVEWGDLGHIRKVRRHIPLNDNHSVILYHLDSANLTHYSHEDIEEMFTL